MCTSVPCCLLCAGDKRLDEWVSADKVSLWPPPSRQRKGTASPASSLQIHGSGYERVSREGMLGVNVSGHWVR